MAKRKKPRVGDLKHNPRNPNRVSAGHMERMERSLAEFGDLSGFVFNRELGMLVGGHQRAKILKEAEVEITEELDAPEPDGTVAWGYVHHNGLRYVYREVKWDEGVHNAAMLAANRFGRVGHDDSEVLVELLRELQGSGLDMDMIGYDESALEKLFKDTDPVSLEPEPEPQGGDEVRCPKCGFDFVP